MKKGYILLFLLVINLITNAQIADIYADEFPDSANVRFAVSGNYSFNSNAITNEFISKFFRGGYINGDLKNSILTRIKDENRMGADVSTGIYCALKLDSLFHKKNMSIFFSLHDREHFDALFSKDLFKVAFFGNAEYIGKAANLSGFNLNLMRYQQLQIGIFSSKLDSAAHWGIGISFLKGEEYISILAKKAEMFTSEDGQFVDFNTSLQVALSDKTNKGLSAINGYGASLDIYFEAPFKTRFGNSKLKISVADIGAVRFNKNTEVINQDSLFHYTGFKIISIYDLQGTTYSKTSQDSIINSIVPLKKTTFSATLPATLNLTFETRFSKRFLLTEGIRYIYNANYTLLAYLKCDIFINKKNTLSANIGYGGYGQLNYGIGTFLKFRNDFIIYAGSTNIAGFVAPKKTAGQGAYISLIKNFK